MRIGISDHFLQLLHGYSIGWSGIKRDADHTDPHPKDAYFWVSRTICTSSFGN